MRARPSARRRGSVAPARAIRGAVARPSRTRPETRCLPRPRERPGGPGRAPRPPRPPEPFRARSDEGRRGAGRKVAPSPCDMQRATSTAVLVAGMRGQARGQGASSRSPARR